MRFPRVKAEGQSFYHCVSRVVDRQFISRPPATVPPRGRKICATDATGWSLLAAYDEIVEPFWVSGAGIEVA
jgi:hypothetical protein